MDIRTINGSSNDLKSIFKNLPASAQYEINVEAVVTIDQIDKVTNQTRKVSHNSLPASLTCHTSPKPPMSLRLVKVGYTDASITWTPPNTGKTEVIKEYIVRCVTMDTNGSKVIIGTERVQSALKKTNINVTGLSMGYMYGFSVKVSKNSFFFN